jgi:hypothetical protein
MPAGPPDPTQRNHANPIFEVSNVRRSLGYYRDALGLTPSWMWEDRIAGVCTVETPVELYLAYADSPSPSRLSVFVDDTRCAAARSDAFRARGVGRNGITSAQGGGCY